MRKIISVIYLLCFFSLMNSLSAQVTFTASSANPQCDNSNFCVEISVTNFDSVTSFQHVYDWDTTIMQLTSFMDMMPEGFGVPPAMDSTDVGRGPYSWFNIPYTNLADDFVIAELCFTANNIGTGTINFLGSNTTILTVSALVNGTNTADVPASYNAGTITVEDTENPVITCPMNIVMTSNGTNISGIEPASFSDNCAVASVTFNMVNNGMNVGSGNDDASGQFFGSGTTTVTYTITDEAGNTNDCSFDVTLNAVPPGDDDLQFIPEINFDCDLGTVSINMLVVNFDSITGVQYGIQWDTSILTYVGATNGLPPAASYNAANDSSLLFLWFPFSGNPLTLADSTIIFTLDYTLNGNFETPLLDFVSFPGIPIGAGQIQDGTDESILPAFMPEIINIIDNTGPMITGCPMDINMFNDADSCNAVVNWTAPTITDNCGIDTIIVSHMPGDIFDVGTTTVSYTVTDIGGNTENCSFDVTVTDNEDPSITCPGNVTVDATLGTCSNSTVNIGTATATDNCGVASITSDAPASFPVGTTTVTWTATDDNGRTATCTQTITIVDNENPVITCPANISQCPGGTVTLGMATATDNCGVASITNDAPATFPVGTTTVTWTATDDNGRTATCTQTVDIVDDEDPVITCPANISQCPGGTVTLGMATATDNCGVASITSDAPATFPVGTTTVTWTATDDGGRTATCTQTVTIDDTEDPVITCPANISQCPGGTVTLGMATATDNCGVASITSDAPATFPLGTTTVTWTATDDNGRTATCTQTVSIIDDEDPMITCPGDISQCPGGTVTLGTPTTSDNCGVASVTNDAPTTFPIGNTVVTWTVTDDGGRTATCTQNVNIVDSEIPTIMCPSDIGQCPGGTVTLGTPTTSDNCGVASVTNDAPATFPVGMTIVTWTVTDVAGLTATCQQRVTIEDDEAPMITCPLTDAIDAAPGTCSGVYSNSLTPTVSDNCDMDVTVTYTIENGGVITNGTDDATGLTFNVGSNNLTYYVEDDNGNIDSCTVVVQVNDIELPSVVCPSNVTVFVPTGTVDTMLTGLNLTASDNCGIASTTYGYAGELTGTGLGSDASVTFFPPGTTTVTYYVEDVNGLQDSCSFDVNVLTVSNDLIDCPVDQIVSNDADSCGAIVNGLAPILNAPIGDIASITYVLEDATTGSGNNDASGEYFNVGTTSITYTAMDNLGNSDTCMVLVTVNDTELPTWSNCPSNISVSIASGGTCTTNVTWTAPSPNDNCGVMQTIPSHNPGDLFPIGTTTVSYAAIDAAGNIGTCSFDVIVVDDTAPIPMGCPSNITIAPNLPDCEAVVNWTPPTFTDCPPITVTSTHDPGDTFPLGTTTVIYIAIDGNGNDTTCTFNVIVEDSEAPVPTCPSDITVNSLADDCGAFVNWPAISATDNCDDNVVVSESPAMGTFFPVGSTTVTVTATDDAGNSSTCTFNVIVNDAIAPEFECADDVVINLDGTITPSNHPYIISAAPNSNCDGMVVLYNNPTSTDNCGVDNVTVTGIGSGGDFPIGTSVLEFTAFDAANNFGTCSFSVTVVDFEDINVEIMASNEVCEGEDITFTTDGNMTGATFDWDGPDMFDSQDSNPFINNVTATNAGTYTVVITYANGCTIEGSVDLTVNVAAPVTADSNSPICTEGDIELDLTIPGGAVVNNITWSGPDNFMSNLEDPVILNAASINAGVYSVDVEYNNGCVASTSTTVVFASLPTPEIDIDCITDICLGSSCVLTGTEYAPTPDNYIWTAQPNAGSGLPEDSNDNQISITPTLPGTYIYTYSVMLGECVSEEVSQVIIVHAAPEAIDDSFDVPYETAQEVFVTENDVFNGNIGVSASIVTEPANGTVELTGDGRFTYTPNSGFIGTDQFIYEICYDCGPLLCENALVTITVADDRECVFPTVITPNQDGINDELFINCLEGGNFINNEIIIYNQWGDEVFTASPYQNNWQGTHDGNDLPDGTYYMVFKLDDNAELVKQSITVFR